MPTTTADLFSIETLNTLVVEPVFQASAVLPYLRRINTTATTLYLPQVANGTAAWVPELTVIPDSGVDASELEVTPRKVAAIQAVSNEAIKDANAARIVGAALTDAISRAVDAAFVDGAAPNGPAGMPGVTGVSTVDADPATLDAYTDAISKVQIAGGTPTVIFVSPADWASLQKLRTVTDSNIPALTPVAGPSAAPRPTLFGLPVSVVAALNTGTAWVLDGTRTVTVQRTPATLETSDGPLFTSDGVMIRVTMRLEFASVYPPTACKINDVTP